VTLPAPDQTTFAYLVINDRDGLAGAWLDEDRAHKSARESGSVVVKVPVVADYRRDTPRPAPLLVDFELFRKTVDALMGPPPPAGPDRPADDQKEGGGNPQPPEIQD
jgi:hypothetical protein